MHDAARSTHRIDIHQHFLPAHAGVREHLASVATNTGWKFPAENLPWAPEKALAFMDQLGIAATVLSLTGSPGGQGVGKANREFARVLNLAASEIVHEYPDRFGFFANIPIPTDTEAALDELRFALDELGADGLNLTSSYGAGDAAVYVADDALDPIWEELDRRSSVVFIHGDQTLGRNAPPSPLLPVPVTEVPNETYKAAAHLVTSGKKRRFENVKVILSHAGGSTPILAGRVAGLSRHQGCELTPVEIIHDFATFYYETALAGHETTLAALESLVASDHLLFGTDYPAVSLATAAWYTDQVDEYFADRCIARDELMFRNAQALLPSLCARMRRGASSAA
jgi:6-methylsalicylate decarboxylase